MSGRAATAAVAAVSLAAGLLGATGTSAAASAPALPFGHSCTTQEGVRFCPTPTPAAGDDERVPSWDGTPLDVDVTLPPSGSAPFPTIVMVHGFTYDKTAFEGDGSFGGTHYSNLWFAHHGYAVVNLSVRGVGGSCGSAESRAIAPQACAGAEFELGDQRYDARDIQQLLGVLVDEGIADPHGLGVTGISLGSLETLELALLRNRIRLLDGSFAPWRSPKGTPLEISAASPVWAIGDLVDLAAPNGRFLDFQPATATSDRNPVGVVRLSFTTVSAAALPLVTYSVPPTPGSFDVVGDLTYGLALTPDDPQLARILDDFAEYHQSVGMPIAGATAPILMEDGWADGIVGGAEQALRLLDYVKATAPASKVAIQLADYGHGIDDNKAADATALSDQTTGFFDHYLRGTGTVPPAFTAYTDTCPAAAPSAGPFTAPSWSALHPGAVRFGSAATQSVTAGGDPAVTAKLDPVAGQDGHCPALTASDSPGTAVYAKPVTRAFTMLGLPTLRFDVVANGNYGELEGRLWDVAPDGTETFVTRGVCRLTNNQQGAVTFQLFGAGYRFPAGHTIRLELLSAGPPTFRPPQGVVTIDVSKLSVELPAHEAPDGGEILAPLNSTPAAPCASRRTVTVHTRGLRHVAVKAAGRRVKVTHGRALIDLRGKPRQTVTVTVTGIGRRGRRVRRVQVFHPCVAGRRAPG